MAIPDHCLFEIDDYPRSFKFRERIAGDLRLISNRIQCSERDEAAPRRENRQKQRREILPEPIVPALRIGTGSGALYGWVWLGRRSGDGRFSNWKWRFLSLALLLFGFLVLAIPRGW